jgi:hypothetical protein
MNSLLLIDCSTSFRAFKWDVIFLAWRAYLRVFSVSSMNSLALLTQAMNKVRELPPSDYLRILVNFEFLYGMCFCYPD